MVLCRFFLQGNCRYGNNCRFEHIYNANINPAHHQQTQLTQQPNSNDFCESVRHDLDSAERGKQWLLSCYCPFPSKSACLPGLDDYSPEELRCLMYQAQLSGSADVCRQHIQKLYQDAQTKRNIFKSQSPDCKAILERVLSGPASPSHQFQSGNTFGGVSPTSPTNSFGAGAVSQASPQNPFGSGGVSPTQPASPFGAAKAPQTSVFNANPFIRGGGSTSGQPSIFGGSAAPSQAPLLGGTYSGQTSIFGGGSPTINSFSFAAAAAQNQGLIPTGPPPAYAPAPTSQPPVQTFMTAPSTIAGGTIFGGATQQPVQAVANSNATAVAGAASRPINPFASSSQPVRVVAPLTDSGAYTALNELTEDEKAQFMAATFSKGRIPLRPPPNQLCT